MKPSELVQEEKEIKRRRRPTRKRRTTTSARVNPHLTTLKGEGDSVSSICFRSFPMNLRAHSDSGLDRYYYFFRVSCPKIVPRME